MTKHNLIVIALLLTSCANVRSFFEDRIYTTPVWWERDRVVEPIPVDFINQQIRSIGPNLPGRDALPPLILEVPEEPIEVDPAYSEPGTIIT